MGKSQQLATKTEHVFEMCKLLAHPLAQALAQKNGPDSPAEGQKSRLGADLAFTCTWDTCESGTLPVRMRQLRIT